MNSKKSLRYWQRVRKAAVGHISENGFPNDGMNTLLASVIKHYEDLSHKMGYQSLGILVAEIYLAMRRHLATNS